MPNSTIVTRNNMVRAALTKRKISGAVPSVEPKVRERYLAKLKEAEEIAWQFPVGSYERESWNNIANGYRYLLDPAPKANGLV